MKRVKTKVNINNIEREIEPFQYGDNIEAELYKIFQAETAQVLNVDEIEEFKSESKLRKGR